MRWVGAAAVVAFLISASSLHAATLFSDISGGQINSNIRWVFGQWGTENDSPAFGFTPTQTGNVTEIDLGLFCCSQSSLTATLWTNSGGRLGTELGSWGATTNQISPSRPIAAVQASGVQVRAGSPYFLQLSSSSPYMAWQLNDQGVTGPVYEIPQKPAGSVVPTAAFAILGTPSPSPTVSAFTLAELSREAYSANPSQFGSFAPINTVGSAGQDGFGATAFQNVFDPNEILRKLRFVRRRTT